MELHPADAVPGKDQSKVFQNPLGYVFSGLHCHLYCVSTISRSFSADAAIHFIILLKGSFTVQLGSRWISPMLSLIRPTCYLCLKQWKQASLLFTGSFAQTVCS